jgi:hypothetical protein
LRTPKGNNEYSFFARCSGRVRGILARPYPRQGMKKLLSHGDSRWKVTWWQRYECHWPAGQSSEWQITRIGYNPRQQANGGAFAPIPTNSTNACNYQKFVRKNAA